jgi:hypothetical protein
MMNLLQMPLRGAHRERVLADAVAILQPIADRWRPGWQPEKVRRVLAVQLCELHDHLSVEQAELLVAEAGGRVVWPAVLGA